MVWCKFLLAGVLFAAEFRLVCFSSVVQKRIKELSDYG